MRGDVMMRRDDSRRRIEAESAKCSSELLSSLDYAIKSDVREEVLEQGG
jgi:hypothetical protein